MGTKECTDQPMRGSFKLFVGGGGSLLSSGAGLTKTHLRVVLRILNLWKADSFEKRSSELIR